MALAKWCKTAGLQDQWRAHLGNVLALNPDHQEARTMLSYKRVDGVWLTPQEIAGANTRAAAAVAALNKWKPKLLAIRNGLKQSNPNARKWPASSWPEVQDAAAIPALELVFCGDTEPMALVGVEKFAEMTVNDASLALARQALFSPWQAVRKAAAEKLKTRDRETYVPELLSAMASPTQSRMELFQEPDGRLLYRHAFYRPGQERDELLVLDTMYNNTFALSPSYPCPVRTMPVRSLRFIPMGAAPHCCPTERCGRTVRSRHMACLARDVAANPSRVWPYAVRNSIRPLRPARLPGQSGPRCGCWRPKPRRRSAPPRRPKPEKRLSRSRTSRPSP